MIELSNLLPVQVTAATIVATVASWKVLKQALRTITATPKIYPLGHWRLQQPMKEIAQFLAPKKCSVCGSWEDQEDIQDWQNTGDKICRDCANIFYYNDEAYMKYGGCPLDHCAKEECNTYTNRSKHQQFSHD